MFEILIIPLFLTSQVLAQEAACVSSATQCATMMADHYNVCASTYSSSAKGSKTSQYQAKIAKCLCDVYTSW
jgi:hypothetical protein